MTPSWTRGGLWLPLATVVISIVFLSATGARPVTSLIAVAIVAVQGWSGFVVWSALRSRRASTAECIGMGLALGTAAATVTGLAVQLLTGFRCGWVLPSIVLTGLLIVRRLHGRHATPMPRPSGLTIPVVSGLAIGGVLGLGSIAVNLANYPLRWVGSWQGYHPDMLFFEALGTSLARLGPTDSIFSSGAQIRYHWLAYAWAGQVSDAAGAEPFVVLTRVLPLTAVVAVVFLAVSWAARLSRVVWVPALAAALILAGGYVGATYGTILNFDSPSQSMSTVWLLSLCIAFLAALSARRNVPWILGTMILLAFVAAGSKISSGAIGVAAIAFVWLLGAVRRLPWRKRALAALVVSSLGLIGAYGLVVAGSADPGGLMVGSLLDRASSVQGLNPLNSAVGIVIGTGLLVIAISIRWTGLLWLLARSPSRWRPTSLLGLGLAITGGLSVIMISGGLNDTWIALAASAPLSVLSAVGAGRAARHVGAAALGDPISRPLLLAVLAAIALVAGVTLLWMTGGSGGNVWTSSFRWVGPIFALAGGVMAGALIGTDDRLRGPKLLRWAGMSVIVLVFTAVPARALGIVAPQFGVQPGTGLSEEYFTAKEPFIEGRDTDQISQWSDGQQTAGAWLRSRATAGELLATNVTYSPLVPALSGVQALAAGLQYQAPYGRPGGLAELVQREDLSWDFIEAPSAGLATALCDLGVRWAWVDPERTATRDWTPWASVVWQSADVLLLRMQSCGG